MGSSEVLSLNDSAPHSDKKEDEMNDVPDPDEDDLDDLDGNIYEILLILKDELLTKQTCSTNFPPLALIKTKISDPNSQPKSLPKGNLFQPPMTSRQIDSLESYRSRWLHS